MDMDVHFVDLIKNLCDNDSFKRQKSLLKIEREVSDNTLTDKREVRVMSEQEVVYTVQVLVTKQHLHQIIKFLNRDLDEGEQSLTIEEVLSKPELIEYICEMAVEGDGLFNPFDCWNNDGWSDWKDYR